MGDLRFVSDGLWQLDDFWLREAPDGIIVFHRGDEDRPDAWVTRPTLKRAAEYAREQLELTPACPSVAATLQGTDRLVRRLADTLCACGVLTAEAGEELCTRARCNTVLDMAARRGQLRL